MMAIPALSQKGEKARFPGGKTYLYRVNLSNKNGTPYSLLRPWEFLSAKSLERRNKQGLPLDSTDLPQTPAYIETIGNMKGVKVVSKSKWNNTVLVLVHDNGKVCLKVEIVQEEGSSLSHPVYFLAMLWQLQRLAAIHEVVQTPTHLA